MKVLVATTGTQGARKNDFCYVPEGELVQFPTECDGETVDGHCGCRRSMSGMVCLKATTTFKVEDRPAMTPDELTREVKVSLQRAGWDKLGADPEDIDEWAEGEVESIRRVAERFDAGTVLERRGRKIQAR